MVQGFALTCIGQTVAAPTREQFTGAVQQRDAAPAISTIGGHGTDKPGTTATEGARRPGDRHALLYRLPLGVSTAHAVLQDHGVRFSVHPDVAGRFSVACPGPPEVLPEVQPPHAMPAAHVYRL